MTAWRVMCRVSGGATGTRQALLKLGGGVVREFGMWEEAQREASRLAYEMNRMSRRALFEYWPVPASQEAPVLAEAPGHRRAIDLKGVRE